MRRLDILGGDGVIATVEVAGSGMMITIATIGQPGTYNTSTGVPTNGIPGYAPCCLFLNPLGGTGTFLYVNTGTVTSAQWSSLA